MVKLFLASLAACLLAACAGRPVTAAFSLPPGIAADASTYSISLPSDEAGQAALPFVERQLRRHGFRPGTSPDFVVTVSTTERKTSSVWTPISGVGAIADPGASL